ncbi:MAG: hypothetical protein EZS28_016762 [Streblomastix strix]|uniref:Uncharacterized protein n=1 Tax=Streblomastix strix TaxID=222440 RepID=A0A5J4VZP5_9EUKA|nr:MAG: hypothetical protein EZS28_016762 [Streblomastix strix]
MMITIVIMMYLENQIQYSYRLEIIEEEERKVEIEARHNLLYNPFYLVINLFKEVRSLSQKSLDGGAGILEQPMGLQIPAPNLLIQKQIAGGSDFNFRSGMDIDMEQMMERDLTQTQSTTNDGPIVSTAPPQLGTASLLAGGDTANIFAAQCANIQHLYDGNEMNIPQQGHIAAQGAEGL